MFYIEYTPPSCFQEMDHLDTDVGEAIETCFSTKDKIQLVWNGCSIILSWTGDVSQMWRDILIMLQRIRNRDPFTINWPSSSFFASWLFSAEGDGVVRINSDWITVSGGASKLSELRLAKTDVEVDLSDFIDQWHKVLRTIRMILDESGYSVSELYGFRSIVDEIEGYQGEPRESLGTS